MNTTSLPSVSFFSSKGVLTAIIFVLVFIVSALLYVDVQMGNHVMNWSSGALKTFSGPGCACPHIQNNSSTAASSSTTATIPSVLSPLPSPLPTSDISNHNNNNNGNSNNGNNNNNGNRIDGNKLGPYPISRCDIIVGVLVSDTKVDRTVAVQRTWAKRFSEGCPHQNVFYYGTTTDASLQRIATQCTDDKYTGLCCKVRSLFLNIWEKGKDWAKWFARIDDDTYVVIKNYVELLSQFNYNETIQVAGHNAASAISGGKGFHNSWGLMKTMLDHNVFDEYVDKCREPVIWDDVVDSSIMYSHGYTVHIDKQMIDPNPILTFEQNPTTEIVPKPTLFHPAYPPHMRILDYILYDIV